MRVLFLRALSAACLALTASAWAGPVSQEDGATAPSDAASSAQRAGAGAEPVDTGDAGKLARMVDEMARGPAASAVPARSASLKEGRAGASKDKDDDKADGGLSERDGPRRPKWLGGEPDTTATTAVPPPVIRERDASGGPAPGTIFDHASVEDRSRMRDILFMVKEVVYHPITWVVVLVLIAASLVSAGRRR
jgi:hypothetical protein